MSEVKKLYAVQPKQAHGWWAICVDENGDVYADESGDGGFLEDTARRLAASWNFCRDIPIDQLEECNKQTETPNYVMPQFKDVLDTVNALSIRSKE